MHLVASLPGWIDSLSGAPARAKSEPVGAASVVRGIAETTARMKASFVVIIIERVWSWKWVVTSRGEEEKGTPTCPAFVFKLPAFKISANHMIFMFQVSYPLRPAFFLSKWLRRKTYQSWRGFIAVEYTAAKPSSTYLSSLDDFTQLRLVDIQTYKVSLNPWPILSSDQS